MSEDPFIFCPECGYLPQRCKCGNKKKSDIIPRTSSEYREKESVKNILEFLPSSFTLDRISDIYGFRSVYEFYHTKETIHCLCNKILDIKSGIIDKSLIFEVAKDFLGKKMQYATIRKKIAKNYFPNLNSIKGGYALQNVFLFLASSDYAVITREGHGLIIEVTSFFMPEDLSFSKKKEDIKYVGTTKGFRTRSFFHLYSSNKYHYLFSGSRLNLETSKIPIKLVESIYKDYKNDVIDRVSTRLDEANRYFPDVEDRDKGFAFQNAFYILDVLGKAKSAKDSRTMVFDLQT